ncbi:MAG: winged helix DNA-binding domain-containing protein [Aggregatilineales bacterium]
MTAIGIHRLYSQHIAQSTEQTPAGVVAWLGALQGQDYYGAKWSVGLRLTGATDAQVEQAIADHDIIRAWLMRGTLHLATHADIYWMLDLLSSRIISGNKSRYKQLELDHTTLMKSNEILADALKNGKHLTRKALFPILEQHGISTAGQRGVHMLQRASLDGLICQSIAERNDPQFFLFDGHPKTPKFTREEALMELAKRYFISRGPATVQDFAWWAGLTLTDARKGLEAIKSLLIEDIIDDVSYWRSAEDKTPIAQKTDSPEVYLLPGFDEFYLGYKDRSPIIDPIYMNNVCPGNNGVFKPTIVINGRIVGIWQRTLKKHAVEITLAPFEPLTGEQIEAIHPVAQRYSDYLEGSLVFTP